MHLNMNIGSPCKCRALVDAEQSNIMHTDLTDLLV